MVRTEPGECDLEDLVSRHEWRESGQRLFARAADTDEQRVTAWSANHPQYLHAPDADISSIQFSSVQYDSLCSPSSNSK